MSTKLPRSIQRAIGASLFAGGILAFGTTAANADTGPPAVQDNNGQKPVSDVVRTVDGALSNATNSVSSLLGGGSERAAVTPAQSDASTRSVPAPTGANQASKEAANTVETRSATGQGTTGQVVEKAATTSAKNVSSPSAPVEDATPRPTPANEASVRSTSVDNIDQADRPEVTAGQGQATNELPTQPVRNSSSGQGDEANASASNAGQPADESTKSLDSKKLGNAADGLLGGHAADQAEIPEFPTNGGNKSVQSPNAVSAPAGQSVPGESGVSVDGSISKETNGTPTGSAGVEVAGDLLGGPSAAGTSDSDSASDEQAPSGSLPGGKVVDGLLGDNPSDPANTTALTGGSPVQKVTGKVGSVTGGGSPLQMVGGLTGGSPVQKVTGTVGSVT
ncbi:hypothetical protein, partial [Arthrobacter pigmenti]